MANKRLFQYAVIYNGKDKTTTSEAEESEILVPVTTILAQDDKEVSIRASRAIPEQYLSKLDAITIPVRPF